MARKPLTSNREYHRLLTELGLDCELAETASPEWEPLVTQLLDWYASPRHAESARVISREAKYSLLRATFQRWLGRKLPRLERDELIEYVADVLAIAAWHGDDPAQAPQVLELEGEAGALLVLRAEAQRRDVGGLGFQPSSCHSPDTHSALVGIFRFDGCRRAFAEHAPGCQACLRALEHFDLHRGGLPEGFDALRTWPAPPAVPAKADELPPLPPVEGVGIIIKAGK